MPLALFAITFSCYAAPQNQSLFLAIGELSEISVPDLKEFTISNNDTLSHKYRPKTNSLLIRGKKQGHSELVVWNKKTTKQVFDVYVLSRAKHLKWIETLKALEDFGLKTNASGRLIRITGSLDKISDWNAFRHLSSSLEKQSELTFINLVSPSEQLRREILADIYQNFLLVYADAIDCQTQSAGPWVLCLLPESVQKRPIVKDVIDRLGSAYFLKVQNVVESAKLSNYKLTFNIYKLEQKNLMETDLTVEKAAGTLSQLNRKDLRALINRDDFTLGEDRYKLSTVANPEIVIRVDKDFNIQMGSDIPYQSTASNDTSTTLFRFAGLKISGVISSSPVGNVLDYQVELSAPANEGAISGNKKSSSIVLQDNQEITAFKLSYQSDGIDKKSLPFISRIPVLGALFSETLDSHEEKIIIGSVTLEPIL